MGNNLLARPGLLGSFLLLVSVACSVQRTPTEPNFIVVVVDMLRADHLGFYGYDKESSPNLDRMAATLHAGKCCYTTSTPSRRKG